MRFLRTTLMMFLALGVWSQAQTAPHAASTHGAKKAGAESTADTHYYGAIDLGSKGSKAALYSFVMDEDGPNPTVVFTKTINTKLVSSMQDGNFTPDGIADAAGAVKQLVEAMRADASKENIDVDTYYIVGSSGVAHGANKADLVTAVKNATGLDMDFVDVAHEGYYGLISSVPRSVRSESMYMDIGSGNTKLGCLVGGTDIGSFKSAEIPYGSVSGRNEALKRNPGDIKAGMESVSTDVTAAYGKQSLDVPCLRNRQRIYWTGGAAWAAATYTHPERVLNGWVTIRKHDLDVFLASLEDGTWNQKKPVYVFPTDMPAAKQALIRTKAGKDRDDVQNVFVREDLISGISIMEAVLNSSNPAATIRFSRSGNFIYGYALEKFKADNMAQGN